MINNNVYPNLILNVSRKRILVMLLRDCIWMGMVDVRVCVRIIWGRMLSLGLRLMVICSIIVLNVQSNQLVKASLLTNCLTPANIHNCLPQLSTPHHFSINFRVPSRITSICSKNCMEWIMFIAQNTIKYRIFMYV